MKIATLIFNTILTSIFLIASIALSLTLTGFGNNYHFFSVLSGSMGRALPQGSLAITKNQASYGVGDIATYRPFGVDQKSTITHRVVEKVGLNQELLVLKGDANESADIRPIPKDRVVGRVIFYLPLIGYLISAAQTPLGSIILIIIPATIIIYEELRSLARNINNYKNNLAARRLEGTR